MKVIKGLADIDYKTNPEGRLLFTALTILTTQNYPDKTPDGVVGILNEKSSFIDENKKSFEDQISDEMAKLVSDEIGKLNTL